MTGPSMAADDVRRFAYRQGPGKRLLGEQHQVDDAHPTTALLPPPQARGTTGLPLPMDVYETLAATPFPHRCRDTAGAAEGDRVGAILLTALGLQRREPDHQYDDHRAVASGRAKYPVHAFLAHHDSLRYLDLYRHALVDIRPAAPDAGDAGNVGDDRDDRDPGDDTARIVLAARYSDLPAAYGRLRFAVCEAELGINLRALCVAADLFGEPIEAEPVTAPVTAPPHPAFRLLTAAGPGHWSAPLVARLPQPRPPRPSRPLPGPPGRPEPADSGGAARHRLLESAAQDPTVAESSAVSALRATAAPPGSPQPPSPAHGLPLHPTPSSVSPVSWADVLWRRTAGRVSGRRYGFALRPAPVGRATLDNLLAWAAVPPPDPLVAEVGRHVRTTLVLSGVGDLPDGVHRLHAGRPHPHRADPGVLARLEPGFARPSSPTTDIALRHASVLWVHSTDTDALFDALGPGALALLNLWCGWTIHGLCLAAAATGLIARPARSYDEHHVQPLLGLERKEVPVFMTVCGTPRFTAPMLDLRP
ncbi:hypothetical protein [Peterkaempfera bronchialis]|uniref:hypothetical protein n=1 Tax=Peterkaempfera bronchialis TaxID=2126346 RepID=UPI0013B3F319|nr:hypothetical protein [Peterkaempfera bronchialis]